MKGHCFPVINELIRKYVFFKYISNYFNLLSLYPHRPSCDRPPRPDLLAPQPCLRKPTKVFHDAEEERERVRERERERQRGERRARGNPSFCL